MNATKKETAPGWLNIKNIIGALTALGLLGGGGAAIGYNSKDSKEVQVNNVNVKEVLQTAKDWDNERDIICSQKNEYAQKRITQTQDEMRQNNQDLIDKTNLIIKELRDIKRIINENNLTEK